jgi:hypothetical protein
MSLIASPTVNQCAVRRKNESSYYKDNAVMKVTLSRAELSAGTGNFVYATEGMHGNFCKLRQAITTIKSLLAILVFLLLYYLSMADRKLQLRPCPSRPHFVARGQDEYTQDTPF